MIKRWLLALLFLFQSSDGVWAQTVDTLRIMAYNILNFPQNNNPDRTPYFRTVFHNAKADLIILGEITSNAGLNMLRDQALNVRGWTDWAYAPFVDGPDTDMALIYRTSKVQWLRNITLTTELRNIQVYHLKLAGRDSATTHFYLYAMHLKAGNSTEEAAQRGREATIARNHANSLPAGSRFFYTGDLNLYSSSEPAYAVFTGSQSNNNGRAVDLLPAGNWNNNSNFRFIHTQSPRTRSFGGGTTGGMDDRFDFILPSPNFTHPSGSRYVPSSFRAYGNDGNHFNDSINSRPNTAVPDSVADALHYGADHLPVFGDFIFVGGVTDVTDPPAPLPQTFALSAFPNPFNGTLTLSVNTPRYVPNASWQLYNVSGQLVYQSVARAYSIGEHRISWSAPSHLTSGNYLLVWKGSEQQQQTVPILYIR